MVKTITNKNMFQMANDILKYVKTNYTLPNKLTYNGTNFYKLEMAYIISYGIYHLRNPTITIPNYEEYAKYTGDKVNIKIPKTGYLDMAKRVYNHIEKYKKCPGTVRYGNYKINIELYIASMSKAINYYWNHKTLPDTCNFYYNDFIKPEPTPTKTYPEKVYDWFCETFNCKPTCFDDCLEYIGGKGYGYYYDDQFTNKESIQRMKKGNGVNCTDACHVFYNLARYFIQQGKYRKVQCIHVMCRGGDGHVRLRIQLNDGDYFYRDPASVLDGNGIESNWCMNGTVVAYDPGWFMANLER